MNSSGSAKSSTSGPTMIPATISSTTTGMASRGCVTPAAIAASAATVTITRNEPESTVTIAAPSYVLRLPQRKSRGRRQAGGSPAAVSANQVPPNSTTSLQRTSPFGSST